MMKKISLLIAIILGATLASANAPQAGASTEVTKYDSWAKYYSKHKEDLQPYMNLDGQSTKKLIPDYVNGVFILRDVNKKTYTTNIVQASSYTYKYLPSYEWWFGVSGDWTNPGSEPDWFTDGCSYFYQSCDWNQYVAEQMAAAESFCSGDDYIPMEYVEAPDCQQRISGGESVTTTETVQDKKKVKFTLAPALFFDFDWRKKVINKTLHKGEATALDMDQALVAKNDKLQLGQDQDGYRVEKSFEYTVGLGVAGTWHYINANGIDKYLQAYVGVAPVVGRRVETVFNVATKKQIENLPLRRKVPFKAEDTANWAEQDSVKYQTVGGIAFFAGAGVPFLNIGVNHIATGSFETYVEKIAPQKVYVKITKINLKALAQVNGLALASVAVSKFGSVDSDFSYMFDLSDSAAAMAYEDLLKGNLIAAQEMALNPSNKNVIPVATQKGATQGKMKSLGFGIPYLANGSIARGEMTRVSERQFHPDQSVSNVKYAIYVDTAKNSRVLKKHRSETASFYAATYETTDKAGVKNQGYFSEFVWTYENDKAKAHNVATTLKRLAKMTGLSHEIGLELPEGTTQLGYTAVAVKASLAAATTNILMNLQKDGETQKTLGNLAQGYAQAYFKHGKDELELCGADEEFLTCQKRVRQETQKAVAKMNSSLKKMAGMDTFTQEFVDAYADFGQAMLENPFSFQSVFALTKGRGVQLYFEIQGENMSYFSKRLEWIPELVK